MGTTSSAPVTSAAATVIAAGLAGDDSAFTPGAAIWTAAHAAELDDAYVKRPDMGGGEFFTKLTKQLEGVSDGAKQLFAELFYLNLLPLSDYYGATKRKAVETVLAMMSQPVSIPPELAEALDHGVFNGGVAFKTRRWAQLAVLVQFVGQWKALSAGSREDALSDPWAFKAIVAAAPGPREPSQRTALLYLAFPDVVIPIVSTHHKQLIVRAFADELPDPTKDLDRDVLAIKRSLLARHGGEDLDLYQQPWVGRWRPGHSDPELEPDPSLARAWLVRGSAVAGVNVVPQWLADGFVSIAAAHLTPVEAGTPQEDLQRIVESDYAHLSYNQRKAKVVELHSFLNRMRVGDAVLTTGEGLTHVGRVTSDAEHDPEGDQRTTIRRTVTWDARMLEFDELPEALKGRLKSSATVVDLTEIVDLVEGLFSAAPIQPPEPRVTSSATLPDLDEATVRRLLVAAEWLHEFVDLLRNRRQVVLYGPPGTGKTYLALQVAERLTDPANVRLVQFHPAYSYEDFFEGYRPTAVDDAGRVGFALTPGPFRKIVDDARQNPSEPYVLIIDELNRANLAKVFGELYFLLEYRDRAIDLMYSSGDEGRDFTLPPNVYVVGTMNTADRSIALVDAAMRRRFAFLSLHPADPHLRGVLRAWLARAELPLEPADLLAELNSRVPDRDFAIGPSYLMRREAGSEAGLDRIWRTSILPLLEEFHYGEAGFDVAARYGLAALRKSLSTDTDEPDL